MKSSVQLLDFLGCVASAMDRISPAVSDHHRRVAYIAGVLARTLGFGDEDLRQIMVAALLHDVGALSLEARLDTLPFDEEDLHNHSAIGASILAVSPELAVPAAIIREHHEPWYSPDRRAREPSEESLVLNLADRVDVLIHRDRPILGQVSDIWGAIASRSGRRFVPQHVHAFRDMAAREAFWLDITSGRLDCSLRDSFAAINRELDGAETDRLCKLFSRIVDFRSRFTATHSRGVAAAAATLGAMTGGSLGECRLLEAAGDLHDLGKLAVPVEILEKRNQLDESERDVVRTHTYHTYHILKPMGLPHLAEWAAYHHERLDGTGYPFHLTADGLSWGARILAVADVFTALTEDRPYRPRLTRDETVRVMGKLATDEVVDRDLVGAALGAFELLDEARALAQAEIGQTYRECDAVAA